MLVDRFLDHLALEKRFSAHTVAAYRADLALFSAYLQEQGVARAEDCDDQLVRYWVMARIEQGDSPRTVNRRLSALRGFYRFARRMGATDRDPTALVEPPKTSRRLPEFVEEARMDQLFQSERRGEGLRQAAELLILELLYGPGIRLAELLGIRPEDVDAARGTLRVLGKRNKERIVPLGDGALMRLQAYGAARSGALGPPAAGTPLLVGENGEPLSRRSVQRIVQRYLGEVTSQRKRSPHVLRHTFATHMLDRGADLNAVKEILGHASLAATQVYTHNTAEKLKKVHAHAHPRGGRRDR